MTTKTENKVEYGLQSVITKKSLLILPTKKVEPNELIDYNISPFVGYNVDVNSILITLTISATIKETTELVLEESDLFVFNVKDLKNLMIISKDGNQITFKDQANNGLITIMLSIAYSTMRGILIEKTKNTVLQGKPLPIIDPKSFFKHDTVIPKLK